MINNPQPPTDWQELTPWFKVIRRLVSAARSNDESYAVVTVSVVIDSCGRPALWKEPTVSRIEPRLKTERIQQFFEHFGE